MFEEKHKNIGGASINYPELMHRVNGNQELLHQIITLFSKISPILMMKIEEGFRFNNGEQVRQAAHNLRGMVSNFSALTVLNTVKEIEALVKTGDFSCWEPLTQTLKDNLSVLDHELHQLQDNKNQTVSAETI